MGTTLDLPLSPTWVSLTVKTSPLPTKSFLTGGRRRAAHGTFWTTLNDTQFNFGMHRGSTYLEVLRQHPDYYHWGLQEKKPSPQLMAYLTWVYRHFVMPPAGAGTATLRKRPLSVEEIDLDRARSEAVLNKKPKSKLSMLRQQDEPCAGGCPAHAISRAGSNSYVVKTTCMLCGH